MPYLSTAKLVILEFGMPRTVDLSGVEDFAEVIEKIRTKQNEKKIQTKPDSPNIRSLCVKNKVLTYIGFSFVH